LGSGGCLGTPCSNAKAHASLRFSTLRFYFCLNHFYQTVAPECVVGMFVLARFCALSGFTGRRDPLKAQMAMCACFTSKANWRVVSYQWMKVFLVKQRALDELGVGIEDIIRRCDVLPFVSAPLGGEINARRHHDVGKRP
jgi:hypothetical protein